MSFRIIWYIMMLISDLEGSCNIELISRVLKVDFNTLSKLIKHFELWLDNTYKGEQNNFRWNHSSVTNFITSKCSFDEIVILTKYKAEFIAKYPGEIQLYSGWKRYYENLNYYYFNKQYKYLLEVVKLNLKLFYEHSESDNLFSFFLLTNYYAAIRLKSPKDIILLGLLFEYFIPLSESEIKLMSDTSYFVIIPVSKPENNSLTIASYRMEDVQAKNVLERLPTIRSKYFKSMLKSIILDYLDDSIEEDLLQVLIREIFKVMNIDIKNFVELYEYFRKLAEELFPDEKKNGIEYNLEARVYGIGNSLTNNNSEKDTIRKSLYTVSNNWDIPKNNIQDITKYQNKMDTYDIWIKEPNEFCYLGINVTQNLRQRQREFLKVILRSAHKGHVYLEDLYNAIGHNFKIQGIIDEDNIKKLSRELHECHSHFGYCINPKDNRGRWIKNEEKPYFEFKNKFSYCLIEEENDFRE